MTNADVRCKIADVFGNRFSSFFQKQKAGNLYRFVAQNPKEALELLRKFEIYFKMYPKEIIYFVAYGADNMANCPIVFHLGVRGYISNTLLDSYGNYSVIK